MRCLLLMVYRLSGTPIPPPKSLRRAGGESHPSTVPRGLGVSSAFYKVMIILLWLTAVSLPVYRGLNTLIVFLSKHICQNQPQGDNYPGFLQYE